MNEQHQEEMELDKARDRFITEIANNVHLYDITNSIGRLYGTIFFAEKPMTLDEMSESLGMSKTSMSTGVRALSEANMIEKAWEKGVRKDLYRTNPDWYKSFSTVFIKRWSQSAAKNHQALCDTKQKLQELSKNADSEEVKHKASLDLEKLRSAEAYYEWLNEVISLFETGEIFNIVPKRNEPSQKV
ncbi:GbsR/MarR family transcriptional regulator [Alkalicoccus daliensis]|uniref:HTH-type transcriptional regulator n=1 Tax=Alkalicoccus daliensis TaxID=745820 RepID=A0A1H0IMK6_9BACI|nr:GbsR/MarR family transcriptional regulator [Alkalicoccus daliensis]SDO32586.1 transcriptional regulator [Alkalicoccus daliensis]